MSASSRPAIGIAGWVLLSFAAAAAGGVASANAGDFYERLVRPAWAPPPYLFGPVWSVLYFLMGIAAGLVWRAGGFEGARLALTLFVVQLGFNALWTWLFFAWRLGMWAFIEIVVLWLLILATMMAFGRIRTLSAWLLLPYLAWVSYAAALTYAVWRLNPQILG
jgi:benzodiazapine receptor